MTDIKLVKGSEPENELTRRGEGFVPAGEILLDEVSARSVDLQCRWSAWRVVGPRELELEVVDGHCTDMKGAILVGKELMPEVEMITVYSGDRRDYRYSKEDDKWVCRP